jgi:copper chaperone
MYIMSQVLLDVPAISCGHCAQRVRNALATTRGVKQVAVDIAAKEVTVLYDDTLIDVERIQALLAESGYPVAAMGRAGAAGELIVTAQSCGSDSCSL